jgi:LysR family transcriptional regulator, glycine cleavage system transcriptional activator
MPSLPPSLDALRVLAVSVRCGNFSRAAKVLHLTPSAVSLRVRSLEAQLGATLFERRGPKLVATDRAVRLARAVDDALDAIQSSLEPRPGQCALRVTCAPTFATRWLIPRLALYHALADAEPVRLDASDAIVASELFDVAIRSGDGGWPGLSRLELLPDSGTPMLSPKLLGNMRMISPRRLLELPLIPDGRWSEWLAAAGVSGETPTFCRTRFATYELEAAAAVQGMGVALLSPILYAPLVAKGELVAPFDVLVRGPRSYWALWKEGAPCPRFARWVAEVLARDERGLAG